jgi:hypothetical protein
VEVATVGERYANALPIPHNRNYNLCFLAQTLAMALLETRQRLGLVLWSDPHVWLIPRYYFVTPLLFTGPLYAAFLGGSLPFQGEWTIRDNLLAVFFRWMGLRNYILVRFQPLSDTPCVAASPLTLILCRHRSRRKSFSVHVFSLCTTLLAPRS